MGMGGGRPPVKRASREGKRCFNQDPAGAAGKMAADSEGVTTTEAGLGIKGERASLVEAMRGLCRAGTFRGHQHSLGDCSFRS